MWDSPRALHTPHLRDSVSSLRFVIPSLKRTRRATLIPSVMTQPRLGKILSALRLNKTHTVLFLGHPYTSKRVLPIKVWITAKHERDAGFIRSDLHLNWQDTSIQPKIKVVQALLRPKANNILPDLG